MRRIKKRKRRKLIRFFVIIFLLFIIMIAASGFFLEIFFKAKTGITISEYSKQAEKIVDDSMKSDFTPNKTTYIYSDDGTRIAKLSEGKSSTYLKYEDIPKNVVNAFIAVEDRDFWKNDGYDMKGIFRGMINIVRYRKISGGGSTITQQLVRNTWLSNEKTFERKIKELILSYSLTYRYSKRRIMEYYINNCCFANGIYGIHDAAKIYLGKEVKNLTLSEIAYLCAIPNRPETYDPFKNPATALVRRNKILRAMRDIGQISDKKCKKAIQEKIKVQSQKKNKIYNYPTTYTVHCAVEYLMKKEGFNFEYSFSSKSDYETYKEKYQKVYQKWHTRLKTGGYKIKTSINLKKQREIQQIVNDTLSFDKTKNNGEYNLQGAVTVIDNQTGKVISIIGGREKNAIYSLNRAWQEPRQPGSTIKPLVVYTPALEYGYTADSMLKDIDVPEAYKAPELIDKQKAISYPLNYAVSHSLNGCAMYLFDQIGIRNGMSYLKEMSFSNITSTDISLSSALGGLTYGTTTSEMAAAYRSLAMHGQYLSNTCILSIKDDEGKEIYKQPAEKQVYRPEAADEMKDILSKVLVEGTGKDIQWYNYSDIKAYGKTGTTNSSKDGWFCGFTDDYTISVWIGKDNHKDIEGLYGGTYPAEIWKEAMLSMYN